jgi:hypothetical protein
VLNLADELKAIKITWKSDEKWLHDYAYQQSSPAAWVKDLMKADYKKNHAEELQKINTDNNLFKFLD